MSQACWPVSDGRARYDQASEAHRLRENRKELVGSWFLYIHLTFGSTFDLR